MGDFTSRSGENGIVFRMVAAPASRASPIRIFGLSILSYTINYLDSHSTPLITEEDLNSISSLRVINPALFFEITREWAVFTMVDADNCGGGTTVNDH
jgi:hypothetical protein